MKRDVSRRHFLTGSLAGLALAGMPDWWLREAEAELQAAALADPILLHHADLLGPLIERLQPVEQVLGEIGDLQEPLR